MATKPSRSDFILKLHDLLEHPLDAESLRWTGDLTFEITSHDRTARHALSGKWEFNSLSSFIRQLSYYNFKRLSDRRRSNDRRMSQSGYIVFSHPSGFFRRGDSSDLGKIVRKSRNRPEKAGNRRVSTTSMVSNGSYEEDTPPMPTWQAANNNTYAHYGYPDDRRSSQHYALGVHHQPTYHMGSTARGGVHDDDGSWRTSFSSVKWQEQNDPSRQDHRRSVDYRVTLPSPRRLEHHGGGRNHAALSIQTNAMSNDIKAYPTPSFQSPSYGQMPLPDTATPSGLPTAYADPSPYSYSQHPVRETSLPSPSDSDDHAASGIDSPPWVSSKLAPIHHHESRGSSSGVQQLQRKASLVSPRQSFFNNLPSHSAPNWNYPLPSPTEPRSYDYGHSSEAQRRAEYFENGSAITTHRDQYRG